MNDGHKVPNVRSAAAKREVRYPLGCIAGSRPERTLQSAVVLDWPLPGETRPPCRLIRAPAGLSSLSTLTAPHA